MSKGIGKAVVDGLIYLAVFGGPIVLVCGLIGGAYYARSHSS